MQFIVLYCWSILRIKTNRKLVQWFKAGFQTVFLSMQTEKLKLVIFYIILGIYTVGFPSAPPPHSQDKKLNWCLSLMDAAIL